ncbi:MAG: PaaI family thioesterase [Bdellovibrionota bacterium]
MDIQTDNSCIICGKNNKHGLNVKFTLDKENKTAFTNVTIGKMFNGYDGIVHGGIVCALLDEAGFYAARTLDVITVTMSLNTKFKKPTPINTELYLEGKVLERRSRSVITHSKIMLGSNVLAEAKGEFFIKK